MRRRLEELESQLEASNKAQSRLEESLKMAQARGSDLDLDLDLDLDERRREEDAVAVVMEEDMSWVIDLMSMEVDVEGGFLILDS